jgi:hypothetical protein
VRSLPRTPKAACKGLCGILRYRELSFGYLLDRKRLGLADYLIDAARVA